MGCATNSLARRGAGGCGPCHVSIRHGTAFPLRPSPQTRPSIARLKAASLGDGQVGLINLLCVAWCQPVNVLQTAAKAKGGIFAGACFNPLSSTSVPGLIRP